MMVSQAIAKGDIQAVNYFVAQKYVQALSEIAQSPNSKLIMMPLDSSQVIGSIAGIGDLVKNLQQKG
jgi:regulator of protease activity HflC (stomatin/prohibitin superfamily)